MVFGFITVVFWKHTVIFMANTVLSDSNELILLAHTVVFGTTKTPSLKGGSTAKV